MKNHYEKPRLIDLSEDNFALGANCEPGTGVTGSCRVGTNATPNCKIGNGAFGGSGCMDGNSATNCKTGNAVT